MIRYSEERKAAGLRKLLPPQNRSVVSVAAEERISDGTLYSWLNSDGNGKCLRQVIVIPEKTGPTKRNFGLSPIGMTHPNVKRRPAQRPPS